MSPPRTVVLDNEAVQAHRTTDHPKHAQVIAHVQVVAQRKRKAIALDVVRRGHRFDSTASSVQPTR